MKKTAGSFEKKIMIAAIAFAAGFVLMIGGVVTSLKNNVHVVTLDDLSEPHSLVEVKPYEEKAGIELDVEAVAKNNKNKAESSQQMKNLENEVPVSQTKEEAIAEMPKTKVKTEPVAMHQRQAEAVMQAEIPKSQSKPQSTQIYDYQTPVVHQNAPDNQPIGTSSETISAQEVSLTSEALSVSRISEVSAISSTPQNNTTPQASTAAETSVEPENPQVPIAPSGHYETVVITPERTVYDVEAFDEPVMENFSVFYDFDGNVLKMIPADKDSVSINPDGSVSSDPVGEYALFVVQNHLGRGNWFVEKHQTGNIHHDAMEGISEEEFKDYKNSLKSRKGLVYKKRTIPAVTEEVWVEDK